MNFFLIIQSLTVALIGVRMSYIQLFPIIGSFFSYFSTHTVLLPAVGLAGGPLAATIYFALKLSGKTIWYHICNNLGGIAANLSWNNNKIINLLVLCACFILFVIHPLGYQVPLYTLYWLIPVFLVITDQQSLFCRSFRATWMSHAVGSVVWLYLHKVNIIEWSFLTLNPYVVSERILFAFGIMVFYHTLVFSQRCILFFAKKYFSKEIKAIT